MVPPRPKRFKTGPRITGRMAGVSTLLIGASMLGFALISQFAYGLQPCPLCIIQRWPWVAAMVLGLGAVLTHTHKFTQSIIMLAAGMSLIVGAGIASFHVGVEQGWWQGLASCSQALPAGASVDELRAHLLGAATVSCGDVAWRLFGLSMAGYNALISFGLGIALFVKAWHVQGEPVDAH
ncbi:MAG: disulfide bond formation protein B [Pseudomonadota bacterium]